METTLRVFVEVQRQPPHLVIVKRATSPVPLASLGSLRGFTVTVLDDRPQFANRQRFAQADQVLLRRCARRCMPC
ncbi:hypothetical protein [Candidatus Amarobacter glycogenicus]|uniref:hypothetical protein n=1 Tax=Candidatus Amarobacter glycogenicus TaxID=3140699 RepID=UPI003136B0E0|nr:hypothetical protein [Dehalococcoidia bacterium]